MPDIYGGGGAEESVEVRMLRLASGHLAAQAIYVFAKLGIADLLRDDSRTAEELAALSGAQAGVLYRVLRFLATVGVVSELSEARFSLNPLGRTLCSRPAPVIRDNVLLMCSPGYWTSIGGLLEAVTTGQNPFRSAYGQTYFEYLHEHADAAAVFNAAMNSSSRMGVAAILAAYDFSASQIIVDVAGGQGRLLEGILKRNSGARGILFDSPSVLEKVSVDAEVGRRLRKMPGSFFESVPEGGDIYILSRILHDWNDDKATEILLQCRQALRPGTKLLVIEAAPPDKDESGNNWAGVDLLMMLLMDGRERTAADFERLFGRCGLKLARTMRTNSPNWIVEAVSA